MLIDEIFDLLLKNILEKVTKFVIIKNSKNVTFSYSGIDDSNNSIRPSQNLLTEVTKGIYNVYTQAGKQLYRLVLI